MTRNIKCRMKNDKCQKKKLSSNGRLNDVVDRPTALGIPTYNIVCNFPWEQCTSFVSIVLGSSGTPSLARELRKNTHHIVLIGVPSITNKWEFDYRTSLTLERTSKDKLWTPWERGRIGQGSWRDTDRIIATAILALVGLHFYCPVHF